MKATASMAPSSPKTLRLSAWHTPVPYFFGGLSIVLGLIAFALLMLACSYGNLSNDINEDQDQDQDLEAGDSKPDKHDEVVVLEDKYVVVMAGKEIPTFLAIPSSFGRCTCSVLISNDVPKANSSTSEVEMLEEKEKASMSDELHARNTASYEARDQVP